MTTFTKSLTSPIEQEIMHEVKRYSIAVKAGEKEDLLKEIEENIKRLKGELIEQRMHQRNHASLL